MNASLVSIITPSYNCSQYIAETIESIIAQTYTNWELLITDDCSTDNSRDIIQEYCAKDSRIKLYCLPENGGAGAARNNSIKEAQGRYIAFCDSDDKWFPNKLSEQLSFMHSNGYKMTYTYTMVISNVGEQIGMNKRPARVSFNSTCIVNYIATSSVVYDTNDIGKYYMPLIRRRQDWGLWLSILRDIKYAYCLCEPLSYYRQAPNSLSSKKLNLLSYHVDIYQEVLGYSRVRALLFFYLISLPCLVFKKVLEKTKLMLGC